MRKILWTILAALLVTISAPNAHAQILTYEITFTLNTQVGPLPTHGYFVYNRFTNQFLRFVVKWNGLVFDLTSLANNPSYNSNDPVEVVPCLSGATGALATLYLMTVCPDASPRNTAWFGDASSPIDESAEFGFASASDTPKGSIVIYSHLLLSSTLSSTTEEATGNFSVSQFYTAPPVGGAFGHLIHLVAGPVRPLPGVPVDSRIPMETLLGEIRR